MGISCPCYSILLREKVTCLTSDCDKARNVSKLPAFSAIESGRIILPLTPERGIHIMPPVNTTRFTLRGYSSAGRALAWHARGQRFDPAILHQKSTVLRRKYGAFLFAFLEVASRISQMPDFAGAWTATPNSCYFVAFENACSMSDCFAGGRITPPQCKE